MIELWMIAALKYNHRLPRSFCHSGKATLPSPLERYRRKEDAPFLLKPTLHLYTSFTYTSKGPKSRQHCIQSSDALQLRT